MGNIGKEAAPKENEPQPKSIYAVVADDSEPWRDSISETLESNSDFTVEAEDVGTFEQLLNGAMIGKGFAKQADIVILGDFFDENAMNNWSPYYHP